VHLKNVDYLERFRHELHKLGYMLRITLPVSFHLRRQSALAISPKSRFLVVAVDIFSCFFSGPLFVGVGSLFLFGVNDIPSCSFVNAFGHHEHLKPLSYHDLNTSAIFPSCLFYHAHGPPNARCYWPA
jgi:hypothetical protein